MDNKSDFISLQEASQYCGYSQEYLSLRARQKKLKATKRGRNWATTREWLEEYVQQSESYKAKLLQKHLGNQAHPPANLPIYAPDADAWEDNRPEEIAEQEAFKHKLQFAFAYGMAVALLFWDVVHGQHAILQTVQEIQQTAFVAGAGQIVQEYFVWLRSLF